MEVATKRPMTVDEFLAWDDEQEGRHEFDGEEIVEMVGSAGNHEIIVAALLRALGNWLDGTAYLPLASSFRLRAGPAVRLPDAQVYLEPFDGEATISSQPIAVFEVLSPSTARTDRSKKADDYWATPSIQHFVLIEQAFPEAVVLSRGPVAWTRVTVGQDGVLDLAAIGLSLPLAEIYHRVVFRAAKPGTEA